MFGMPRMMGPGMMGPGMMGPGMMMGQGMGGDFPPFQVSVVLLSDYDIRQVMTSLIAYDVSQFCHGRWRLLESG